MSNIHNNSMLQSSSANRGVRPNEAQNESNGQGAAGYCAVQPFDTEVQDESFIDRSDLLTAALCGLATINMTKLSVKKNLMRKAAKAVNKPVVKIA